MLAVRAGELPAGHRPAVTADAAPAIEDVLMGLVEDLADDLMAVNQPPEAICNTELCRRDPRRCVCRRSDESTHIDW